ncbi:hypothetical protein HA402_006953 [Bradysia odoriphaga]|nr:hypothetical protein HA402_006953 [Bradysia odoriphaga]
MAMAEGLWREAAKWLTRCKVIPIEHKANANESEIRVLALTLRDGVLLCNLVNFLDAKVGLDFNRKPQMAQFLCCQNIKYFVDACKNHFGLKESDLFEPMMLYNLTNFHKVLITLAKLSQCDIVKELHKDISGFSAHSSPRERSHSDEDIYKDLHSTTTDSTQMNGHVDEQDTKEEEVYQDLCSIQWASRPQLTASTASFEQRDFVIRELIDTETNYFEVLIALKKKFMQPMEAVLSKDEIKIIFPRIKELADIHDKFLDKLKDATSPTPKCKLSQVFLEFREPFLIYGEYCSNMTAATETLRDLSKRNSAVEKLIEKCQMDHSSGRVQLRDILSVPMQRILKYHLLLDKLVHETLPSHDDYRGLERAKEAMVDVAQYTNEVKRDSEHLGVIQKVKDSIMDLNLPNGHDLRQYGRLLLDGDLNIKAHEDQKTKHRYAFIFEKLMILVKPSNTKDGQYVFRDAHNLNDYRVESSNRPTRTTLVGRDARFKFQLILVRKSQSTAFTLYVKSDAERIKWTKALQEAMETLEPMGCRNTDHKFHITTFHTPIICLHCSKFLKGLIHQGYRCKVCEISVHRGCISSTGRCKQGPVSLPPPVCDRQLSEFYWFVGPMDRDTASIRLENRKIGTYLLRVRPQGASSSTETMYALSLKTDDRVIKHMKINQKREGDSVCYYLSSRRSFKTIVELVSFYERNDLGENFAGLNQTLQWPFKEVLSKALYDFNPKELNQLPLRKDCIVLVIGKEGDSKGWWRGKAMERVGFFPKEYVQEFSPTSPNDL